MKTNLLTKSIDQHYQRKRLNKYGNSYYLMVRDNLSLGVLNDHIRFVTIAFDKHYRHKYTAICKRFQ